jgi:hypothetical protein
MSEAMPAMSSRTTEASAIEKQIERQIVLGTWGRIHNLSVEMTSDGVRVTARAPSHYIKQLVLHAVYEVLGTETTVPLQFDVEVGKLTRHVLPGEDDLWGVPRSQRE